ncbi:MAG TPA: AraC family transcriptional regulator [Rhodocyclaceae bacterium]|nr:AraC family transcriptional regulator [Rhodocyclaceae bacterium]
MKLNFDQHVLNQRRIANVMAYLDSHLDEEITLETLADIAHLSRFHFQRMYTSRVKETPMATVRRLRLQHAFRDIHDGKLDSVTDLAIRSGYGSVAAFSRAFSRAFGKSPTEVMDDPQARLFLPSSLFNPTSASAELALVKLPPIPIVRQTFTGTAKEAFQACDELTWVMTHARVLWRHCGIHPDGWIDPTKRPDARVRMWHCALSNVLPHRVAGAERAFIPPGQYVRFAFVGGPFIDVPHLMARIEAETAWQVVQGPMIRHQVSPQPSTPISERITHFYISVAPK